MTWLSQGNGLHCTFEVFQFDPLQQPKRGDVLDSLQKCRPFKNGRHFGASYRFFCYHGNQRNKHHSHRRTIHPRSETGIHQEGTNMSIIPNPSDLVASARSARRPIEDRQWKQYQRYLAKHKEKYGNPPDEPPISFEEFCAWLTEHHSSPSSQKNHR